MGLLNFLPEDETKKQAARQGLLSLGAAMLSGRGNFGNMLGQGLAAGAQGYQGSLQDQQRAQMMQMQGDRWKLENEQTRAAIAEPGELARIAGTVGRQQGAGAQSGGVMSLASLPTKGAATGAPVEATPQQNPPEYYRALGDAMGANGRVDKAKQYYEIAKNMTPKLKEQRTLTRDGKRVMANVYDDGRTEELQGFAPDAEKLHFANTGGATVGVDQFTGQPVNTIRNTQSPDSLANGQVQMRGQDRQSRDAAASRAQSAQQFGISSGQRAQEMQVRVGGKPMSALQETKYRTQIAKDYQAANTMLANMGDVKSSASAVLNSKGLNRATGLYSYIPSIPDSNASKAQVRLQNLEGKVTNLGKAAAAASGAVGPMAVQEWKIVRDMVAAIDPSKGEESLREQIALVEATAEGATVRMKDAYEKHYSQDFERYPQFAELAALPKKGDPKPAPKPAAPKPKPANKIDSLLDKYKD